VNPTLKDDLQPSEVFRDKMSAQLIDGKAEAARTREEVREGITALQRHTGTVPGLAVILIGADPASEIYVRTKARRAADLGIRSFEYRLAAETSEAAVLALLRELNERDDVDAILVQLPLPPHIASDRVLREIDPAKDADGFHPENVGLLGIGQPALVPCTPLGCLRLAKSVRGSLRGLEAVVVGRSAIVGRPAAQLLLIESCTVTIAHSATDDLPRVCRRADILVVAVGKPELVTGAWLKPGATVIDVGINRIPTEDGKGRIVGDVDFASASRVAGAITPVPGGVGPMTVAMLMHNTLRCARNRRGSRALA
jgi:methylenetetrahydrofolate dehydrogenase (NADP+)/methenyltetrahydrofolate cyclohydrolase